MKRVLFLQSQTYFGADSAIHAQLMEHLDHQSTEVLVACNRRVDNNPAMTALDRLLKIPGIRVRPTEFGPTVFGRPWWERLWKTLTEGPKVPLQLLALAATIRREHIQIIHGTEKPRDAFYGVLLAKLTGARSIIHMHVRYADWLQPTVRWALRNADAVVGVSEFVSQTVIEAGIRPERVHTVVNALDTRDGQWNPRTDGQAVRTEFGISPDALLVGVCSRLFRWKGHVELIQAIGKLHHERPELPLHLMVVGEDDSRANPGGGSFCAELEALVAELGLEKCVTFTGFRRDIPRLMGAFDIYAMPSFEEPLGMVYLEAMALGKPIVAYHSGGVPEVVTDGLTGLLTQPYDIDALAESLLALAKDSGKRQKLGDAGRLHVLSECTPKRMCARMERVYQAVLTGQRESEPVPAIN